MEANKAPEKIYYHKGKLRTPFAVEQRLDETDVEYIRTDAFIKKAIGWIDYNNRNGGCDFDGWGKDFKDYMKESKQ